MSGFRTPELSRDQLVLWEQRLDDAIPGGHPVRDLEAILFSPPFAKTFKEWENEYVLVEGRPPIHPRYLAGLYLYGMLNGIRSSRRLEAACYSHLDVIWLMEKQSPDHSTIAAFVKNHGRHLGKLFRDVVGLLSRAGLIELKHMAVDGTKVEADASKKSVRHRDKIESWLSHIERKVIELEEEWARNEQQEKSLFGDDNPWIPPSEAKQAAKELKRLRRKRGLLQEALKEIERRQDEHVGSSPPKPIASTTDPNCRSMQDKEKRTKPNYNAQIAVDEAHGAIAAADVNDRPQDSGQLTPLVEQAQENCGRNPEAVTADSQYNTGPDLAAMEEKKIVTYLPDAGAKSETAEENSPQEEAVQAVREGRELTEEQWVALPRSRKKRLDRSAFVYDGQKDAHRCPAGHWLTLMGTSRDQKRCGVVVRRRYGNCDACATCPHAQMCCEKPENGRTIGRDQYEEHRERQRLRMASDEGKRIYDRRKWVVEPRFGHIKRTLGMRRFLRRGLEAVRTEWLLACTAVNLGILLRHWNRVAATL
jgi:transposase